ncbi:MAG: hypothetical protein Q7S79_00540 [bacterium]|nr:hypothetical protein [bacterium]
MVHPEIAIWLAGGNRAAGSEVPRLIPPFVDKKVILTTDSFAVVYGYKTGHEGDVEGQRVFLLAKTRKAGKALKEFAQVNGNAIEKRAFGSVTGESLRFRGNAEKLVEYLEGDGISAGFFGSGVPSLEQLEEQVASRR